MPISNTLISNAIKGYFALEGFTGRDMSALADAIGIGVFEDVCTPSITSGFLTGTVGPVGTVTSVSVAGIVSTAMASLIKAKGAQNGFTGRDMGKLADAVANGVCSVLLTMILQGTTVGLAVGAGTANFVGLNANKLSADIKLALPSFTGRDILSLADMVATGIVMHLTSSATFSVVAVGAISPVPPVGPIAITGIPILVPTIS